LEGGILRRATVGQGVALAIAGMAMAGAALADTMAPWYAPASQRAAQFAGFAENRTRDVVEFQPFRAEITGTAADGTALRLTSLNPNINAWFVLDTGAGRTLTRWHLENIAPDLFTVSLGANADTLTIDSAAGTVTCTPWDGALAEARRAGLPYAPICEGRIFLRNRGSGSRTMRESVTDFLRSYVPFGEDLITLIKGTLYEDAFLETSLVVDTDEAGAAVDILGQAALRRAGVMRTQMQVDLIGAQRGQMEAGAWYAVADAPGIYASVVQPGMVHPDILNRRGEANALDGVENNADVYMFAYDMARFDLRYELGTDHPAVGWSPRPSVARRLPGPDGFADLSPLAMTGMLNPVLTDRVAAIFAGGFKREHGAFRAGPMAGTNQGHHYGFVVHGTVLSRLQPGLATMIALDDGTIDMRTWTEADNALLPRIRFARQNGTPLVEPGPEGPRAGENVRSWMGGNWSGSAEAQLRTLRSGACLREIEGRRFLIYAVFSSATPSGMTRTFQAYGCDYAMLLDMNSLDLTYAAVYARRPGTEGFEVLHLDRRMAESDSRGRDGRLRGRFVEFSDNRDFIYLLRR
jgi:hypothetical protein